MVYNPSEPRDPLGRWVEEHGGSRNTSLGEVLQKMPTTEVERTARSPKTPTAVVNRIARSREGNLYYYRPFALANPVVGEDVLSEAKFDDDPHVRAAVASNMSANSKTLAALADDDEPEVLAKVAGNPRASSDDLNKIAEKCWDSDGDDSPKREALMRVARNGNTGQETLSRLAQHPDHLVQVEVSRNSRTSKETLDGLCDTALRDNRIQLQFQLSRNDNTSGKTLDRLAGSPNRLIRRSVVDNPNTPDETLERLGNDSDSYVARNAIMEQDMRRENEALQQDDTYDEDPSGWNDTDFEW